MLLNPRSKILHNVKGVYTLHNKKCSHTLPQIWRHNFIIFASTKSELPQVPEKLKYFSNNINVQFGTNKCRIDMIEMRYKNHY